MTLPDKSQKKIFVLHKKCFALKDCGDSASTRESFHDINAVENSSTFKGYARLKGDFKKE